MSSCIKIAILLIVFLSLLFGAAESATKLQPDALEPQLFANASSFQAGHCTVYTQHKAASISKHSKGDLHLMEISEMQYTPPPKKVDHLMEILEMQYTPKVDPVNEILKMQYTPPPKKVDHLMEILKDAHTPKVDPVNEILKMQYTPPPKKVDHLMEILEMQYTPKVDPVNEILKMQYTPPPKKVDHLMEILEMQHAGAVPHKVDPLMEILKMEHELRDLNISTAQKVDHVLEILKESVSLSANVSHSRQLASEQKNTTEALGDLQDESPPKMDLFFEMIDRAFKFFSREKSEMSSEELLLKKRLEAEYSKRQNYNKNTFHMLSSLAAASR